jgi:hypothetical protein
MITTLNDPASLHHKDLIRSHNRALPVGDHQHRVVALEALNRLLCEQLALGIQLTGGLIKNQQLKVLRIARANNCYRWPPQSEQM